jgi:hypothetical protein
MKHLLLLCVCVPDDTHTLQRQTRVGSTAPDSGTSVLFIDSTPNPDTNLDPLSGTQTRRAAAELLSRTL